ncbi:MAG: response regulator transcription factor [Gammaproteobacteria bacterium]
MNVLLVDDDEDFVNSLSRLLKKFDINTVNELRTSGAEKQIKKSHFDVILLDVMMPEENGFQFLPTIRKISNVPVIMLTALREEDNLVNGLDLGADDYITKPFKINELVARLRALKRRYSFNENKIKTIFDDLELFFYRSTVKVGNVTIKLTESENHILHLLLNAKDYFVTRESLYSKVLKREMLPEDRSLDVHISNLRQKLGAHPTKGNRIRSIRGLGYALTK